VRKALPEEAEAGEALPEEAEAREALPEEQAVLDGWFGGRVLREARARAQDRRLQLR
jgi:hypothetical protein